MTDFGSRHKLSHQDGGGDEIDCAGLDGRVNYVDRGDPEAADWVLGDLTPGGTLQDLDCSNIVPEGATTIYFSVFLLANASQKYFGLREKGNSNAINTLTQWTQVGNVGIYLNGFASCDASRIVQYTSSASGWDVLSITIRGWLI